MGERKPGVDVAGQEDEFDPSRQGNGAFDAVTRDSGRRAADDDARGSQDRLGSLAKSESKAADPDEANRIDDALAQVMQSFHWFTVAAQNRLDVLKRDLKKDDPPSWSQQLAGFMLQTALSAGAEAAGLALASKLVASDIGKEFLQNLFSPGITAGVTAGREKLGGGSDNNVVDPFIDAQKEGVWARQLASQNHFIKVARHQVRTAVGAESLAAACTHDEIKRAAEEQYDASRDSWVSYLAQQKYGTVSSKHGPVANTGTRAPWIDYGETTTNMEDQGSRNRARRRPGGEITTTEHAPDANEALTGDAPGVLTVIADLPAIEREYDLHYGKAGPTTAANFNMKGTPTVALAMLNGVNETIREQYAGQPLAASKVPRQVVARVAGGADFTLNIDEQGAIANRPANVRWLASRAVVAQPGRAKYDDEDNHMKGIEILLNELVPRKVDKNPL